MAAELARERFQGGGGVTGSGAGVEETAGHDTVAARLEIVLEFVYFG